MDIINNYRDRAIKVITERIENSLGGTVSIINDGIAETFTIDWVKNYRTVHELHFNKVYFYKELEKIPDSLALVMDFIKAYRSSETLITESVKVYSDSEEIEELVPEAEELVPEAEEVPEVKSTKKMKK